MKNDDQGLGYSKHVTVTKIEGKIQIFRQNLPDFHTKPKSASGHVGPDFRADPMARLIDRRENCKKRPLETTEHPRSLKGGTCLSHEKMAAVVTYAISFRKSPFFTPLRSVDHTIGGGAETQFFTN